MSEEHPNEEELDEEHPNEEQSDENIEETLDNEVPVIEDSHSQEISLDTQGASGSDCL